MGRSYSINKSVTCIAMLLFVKPISFSAMTSKLYVCGCIERRSSLLMFFLGENNT